MNFLLTDETKFNNEKKFNITALEYLAMKKNYIILNVPNRKGMIRRFPFERISEKNYKQVEHADIDQQKFL